MPAPAPCTGLEQVADILSRLIAFDTESSKSNLELIAWVEDYLAELGIASLRVPNARGDKAALFATIGPVIDGGVVLSGHSDVVPVEGQVWTGHPFHMRRDGGRLYGRGACDMKGFVALVLAMAAEWKALPLLAPLHILISYDEETTASQSE